MEMKKIVQDIVDNIGGFENVESVTHCVTRLRLSLKDQSKANDTVIESIDGVNGVVKQGGQYQIVIGPKVNKIFDEFNSQFNSFKGNTESTEEVENQTIKKGNPFNRMVDVLISCFAPAIPVIAGSGMIKVLVAILVQFNILSADSSTIQILTIFGDAVFYFLPFLIAYTAAQKFKTDLFISMVLAGIILHPKLLAMATEGVTSVSFIGLPVKLLDYSAQAIPVILAVWLLSYVDKFADKVSPDVVKVFLKPMISILVVGTVLLVLFGPIAAVLGEYFAKLIDVMNQWGWVSVGINALIFPFLVITGMHNALIPLIVTMFATNGSDSILLVSGLVVNIVQAGAVFAVAMKTKDIDMRGTAISAGVSAMFGITEPALYGVNLRLKRPFIAVLIASTIAGMFAGIVGVTAYAFVTPTIITLPIFMGDGGVMSLVWAAASMALSFVLAFILVSVLGFKDIESKSSK